MKVTRLVCANCGAQLAGLGWDSTFVCSGCGAAWSQREAGLERIEVEHRAAVDSQFPLPFWKLRATVHVLKRTVRNEFTTTILSYDSRYSSEAMPGKTRESGSGSQRRTLLFPAFHMNGLPGMGVMLSEHLEELPDIIDPGDPFPSVCGCTVAPNDAEVLGRCVAVGQETARADWLAEIELVISSVSTALVILPCTTEVEKVHIAHTGVSFFRRAVPDWNAMVDFRNSLS